MKVIHQEIMVKFRVANDVDVAEVLCELSVDFNDGTGKLNDIDWEYGHTEVEEVTE